MLGGLPPRCSACCSGAVQPSVVGRDRLLTGAEALMLQGVDLGAIQGFSVDTAPSRFLQDLAGNAFCIYKFALIFTACLPEA